MHKLQYQNDAKMVFAIGQIEIIKNEILKVTKDISSHRSCPKARFIPKNKRYSFVLVR